MRRNGIDAFRLSVAIGLGMLASGCATTEKRELVAAPSRVLSIQEMDPGGKAVLDSCPSTAASCSADIASTVVITPDLGTVRRSIARDVVPPKPLPDGTREAREALREALASLERSGELSVNLRKEFEALRASGSRAVSTEDARRTSRLNDDFERERGRAYAALLRYAHADPSPFALDTQTLASDDLALAKINETIKRDQLGSWIAVRAQELQTEAERNAREIQAAAPKLLLRLGAFRIRKGTGVAVHLPGYDSIEARAPRAFDRITTALTDAQRTRLDEEVKFTSAVIQSASAVVSEGKDAAADLEKTRRELADGLSAAREELQVLLPTLKDEVVKGFQALEKDAGAIPSLASQVKVVTDARETAEKLLSTLESTKADIEKLQQAIQEGANAAKRPDQLLVQLLDEIGKLKKSATSTLSTLETLPATVKALEKAIDGLAADPAFKRALAARLSELKQAVARDLAPSVERVIAKSGNIGALFRDGSALFALLRNQATQISNAKALEAIDLSSPSVLSIAESQIMPTELAVLRTDAEDGDILEIVAEVRSDPNANPIHEERRAITVRTFGWSSNVSGGLIFVKSIDVDTSNFKPEPAATWRIGYLPRPNDRSFGAGLGRALKPGVGIHVATLNFSNDTSVEMGAGVNLHLLSDLVQAGYGWNLTAKEKRSYWYLGIGLFELLKVVR